MSCTKTRSGAITALLFLLATAMAGELSRPVPPDAQVTRFTRFNIRYSLRDIVADGVQKVEFYITDDMGRTWSLYGEDPDRTSPMTIQVPGEGVYGFVVIATDRFGNRERAPVPRTRPETVIVVDRTPPTAKWLSPLQNVLGRGQPVDLSWETADPNFGPGPVKIQYTVDARSNHDRDAVWNPVEENLPASGKIAWSPPSGVGGRINFRLVAEDRAGNIAVAYNPATIIIDNTPPRIQSVSPLKSNKLVNDIVVQADDGPDGSGVKEISLYTSENNGITWTLVKETNDNGESVPVKRGPGQGIRFEAPRTGEYPLWPVVFDEAGNATPLPSIAVPGPYILAIDTDPPVVNLSNSFLMGRAAVLANETRRIEWTAYDPNLANNSATIQLSLDNGNTWQEIRSGLPANGSEIINFPFGSQSEEAKIKVTVADEFGNVGEDASETFKLTGAETMIDSVTPRSGASTAPVTPFVEPIQPAPPTIGWQTSPEPQFQPTPSYPTPTPPPATTPYPTAPYYPTAPSYPVAPGPGDPYAPTPGLDIYGGPGSDLYGVITGESTAAPIPQAMLRNVQTPPAAAPVAPFSDQSAGATPPALAWTPSAQQPQSQSSGVSPFGWTDSSSAGSMPVSPQPPPTASAWPPAGTEGFSALIEPPPMSSTGFGAETGAGSDIFSTPLPPADRDDLTLPPMDSSLSLDNMPPLSLPGQVASPEPSMPPASTAIGDLRPPPATSAATAPPAAAPSAPSQPGVNVLAPPPIASAPARPANPRQLSEHYVSQSRAYREEGRMDLARDSAQRAVEADETNARAFMELSQVYARSDPADYVRAANLAKEATTIAPDWETWWNCAEIYYIWSHARNREIQSLLRSGQPPSINLVDERNSTLNNAMIAINNAAASVASAGNEAMKKVAYTHGMIAYLRALTVPEPFNPGETSGPAADEFRRSQAAYKATVTPMLLEAIPFFENAVKLGARAEYNEMFQLGLINFRLAGLERDTGNSRQALIHYQEAAKFLEEATTAPGAPSGAPREAYYMLALCHDQLSEQPGANRARHKELALRYWRQTAEYYEAGSPYRLYSEQRIDALATEMGL